MVMLGGLIAATGIIGKNALDKLFDFALPSAGNKSSEVNKNSILEGINYLENKKSGHL